MIETPIAERGAVIVLTMLFCRRVFTAASLGLLVASATSQASDQAAEQIVELSVGRQRIEAEVASSLAARSQGLMFRREMARHRGMLFVFDQSARHCMWMRNTLIPLAVAFIDDRGRILNIEEMKPETGITHCATAPARYALEMNAGWFSANRLAAGARVRGVARAHAAK